MNIVRPIYKAPIQVNRYMVRFKMKKYNGIWTICVIARNVMEAKKTVLEEPAVEEVYSISLFEENVLTNAGKCDLVNICINKCWEKCDIVNVSRQRRK